MSATSRSVNIKSNLDNIVIGRLMFSEIALEGIYLPYLGLPAASTDALAFNLATIPALAILTVPCSIAS